MSSEYYNFHLRGKDLDCPQNILELSSLEDKLESRLKKTSVFKFDKNADGWLNTEEINDLMLSIGKEDKEINEEELKIYCKENKIKIKDAKAFLDIIKDATPNIQRKSHSYRKTDGDGYRYSYEKHKDYINYNCSYNRAIERSYDNRGKLISIDKSENFDYKAKYYPEDDKFVGTNKLADTTIEITGVQNFVDKYFQNKNINQQSLEELRKNNKNIEYPQIIIKDKFGKEVGKLQIEFKNLPFEDDEYGIEPKSSIQNKDAMIFNITQLMTCIENLQPEVLDDLMYNNSAIILEETKSNLTYGAVGLAYIKGNENDKVAIHVEKGMTVGVLIHEIGHTVDGRSIPRDTDDNYKIYTTYDEDIKKEIDTFVNKLNDKFGIQFANTYALRSDKHPKTGEPVYVELYPEYYAYKNYCEAIKNKSNTTHIDKPASYDFFNYLENNPNCPADIKEQWETVKTKFAEVKPRSREATDYYRNSEERFEKDFPVTGDETDADIIKSNISNIEQTLLSNGGWDKMTEILKDYPELLEKISTSDEIKVNVLLKLRNHKNVKKYLDNAINGIKNKEKIKYLDETAALNYLRKTCNTSAFVKGGVMTKAWVQKKASKENAEYNFNDLLKSEELLNAIKADINDFKEGYSILKQLPDSFIKKFENATEVSPQDFDAIMNLPNVRQFLIDTYNHI